MQGIVLAPRVVHVDIDLNQILGIGLGLFLRLIIPTVPPVSKSGQPPKKGRKPTKRKRRQLTAGIRAKR